MKTYEAHVARRRIREIAFVFIEEREDRAEYLETLLAPFRLRLPEAVILPVACEECGESLNHLLDQLDADRSQLAPAFIMLDPFGLSDTPMSLVGRLLRQPKSEIYISVMWEWLNRFKREQKIWHHLDQLFGTEAWRDALKLPNGPELKKTLTAIYERSLRDHGARYVTHFELWNGNRHVYTIFFATKHPKGMDVMKQAIWKADRTGGYVFRGRRGNQLEIELPEAPLDYTPFANEIRAAFHGHDWFSIEDVENWAQTDATDYHSGQVRKALRELEISGGLEAKSGTGRPRKARTFPAGTLIKLKVGA